MQPLPDFTKLIFHTDLIYYDGPLLSLFEMPAEEGGGKYLVLWIDVEDTPAGAHLWLVAVVDEDTLAIYCAGKIPLRDVLECSPALYKQRGQFGDNPPVPVKWEDIGEEHRPTTDSYIVEM